MTTETSHPTDLEIRFQESVLESCDDRCLDANFIKERDWNYFFDRLTEEDFGDLLEEIVTLAWRNTY